MSAQTFPSVVLDASGEYRPALGYRTVKTDADVLRAYPFREGKIWAQGERAASVCERLAEEDEVAFVALKPCRDWLRELAVREELTGDGFDALRTVFWELTPQDAAGAVTCVERWLLDRRPAFRGLLDTADDLALFLTEGVTDEARAALRWLCQRKPGSGRHRLIGKLMERPDPIAAWLGLDDDTHLQWVDDAAGFLPQTLPPALHARIAEHWRGVLVSADGFELVARVLVKEIGALRKLIRREAELVFDGKLPKERARLENVCGRIFGEDWVVARAAKQAGWPRLDPQSSIPQMLEWFRTYREKATWHQPMCPDRLAAAKSFQDWFLDREHFQKWCAQGENGPLSFCVNGIIRDSVRDASAVLLLLVDGLGYREHGDLMHAVLDRAPMLHRTREQVVLTTLPTITSVCKGSLLSGQPQRKWQTADYKAMVHACRRRNTRSFYYDTFAVGAIIEKLSEPQTSLVAVNYIDLDKAMHDATDAGTIPGRIAGKISELATNISTVAKALHDQSINFGLVITSDHGQVVGPCRQVVAAGEVVKQRLRSLGGDARPFEVFLSREHTLCTDDYYAITDDSAWGAGSTPIFGCHGSIFPEEVVTRLTAYGFKLPETKITIEARGKGITGVNGTISWSVKNLSPVPVTIQRVTLKWADRSIMLTPPTHPVLAFSERNFPEQRVIGWPGPDSVRFVTLEAEYGLHAKGEPLVASGKAQIESESGYEERPFEL